MLHLARPSAVVVWLKGLLDPDGTSRPLGILGIQASGTMQNRAQEHRQDPNRTLQPDCKAATLGFLLKVNLPDFRPVRRLNCISFRYERWEKPSFPREYADEAKGLCSSNSSKFTPFAHLRHRFFAKNRCNSSSRVFGVHAYVIVA